MRIIIGIILAIAAVAGSAQDVFAQTTKTSEEVDAREHFQRGYSAYRRGAYDRAIREWQIAYEKTQKPTIQYNLAQAYERLGRLNDAAKALQYYIDTADKEDKNYSDASARLASLQQRMSLTGIRLIGGQEGALIIVDGLDWGRLPRPDKISVKPGVHKIVVQKKGFRDFVSTISIPAGQVLDIEVNMETKDGSWYPTQPSQGHQQGPVHVTPQKDSSFASEENPPQLQIKNATHNQASYDDSSLFEEPLVWYITSGVLAVGTAGSLLWWLDRADIVSECDDPSIDCQNIDAVKGQRDVAMGLTIGFGIGSIGALVAAILLDTEEKDRSSGQSAVSCNTHGMLGGACTILY